MNGNIGKPGPAEGHWTYSTPCSTLESTIGGALAVDTAFDPTWLAPIKTEEASSTTETKLGTVRLNLLSAATTERNAALVGARPPVLVFGLSLPRSIEEEPEDVLCEPL